MSFSFQDISLLLESYGWNYEESIPNNQDVWEKSGTRIIFPSAISKLKDFNKSLTLSLEELSELESISFSSLFRQLENSQHDIIKLRISNKRTSQGRISIDDGYKVSSALSKLTKSCCKYAVLKTKESFEPSPVYSTRLDEDSSIMMKDITFGQTEKGSYVFSMYSYLQDSPVDLFSRQLEYDRLFLKALQTSLITANKAVKKYLEIQDEEIFKDFIPQGLHANACEAFYELSSISHEDTQLSFQFTGKRPFNLVSDLKIFYKHSDIYRCAAEYLKNLTPETPVEIEGYVVRLDKELSSKTGEIWVASRYQDRERKFHMTLPQNLYSAAISAHTTGSRVFVEGIMVKKGKYWWLESVSNFRSILDENE